MKKFILSLLAVLFLSTYALAQTPPCPCDNETLENGLTGNDIVEIVCPSGNLGEDSESFMGDGGTVISLIDFPHSDYVVRINNTGTPQCTINSDGVEPILLSITQQEYNNCQKRLIQGCDLQISTNVPTLSEWGLIATAGALGIFGLYAIRRKRAIAQS